jgi:hypothetical protein
MIFRLPEKMEMAISSFKAISPPDVDKRGFTLSNPAKSPTSLNSPEPKKKL